MCPTMKKSNKPRPTRSKGSYPLPNGNYVTKGRIDRSGKRAIRIEAVHKDPPDLNKLAEALLFLAEQQSATSASSSDETMNIGVKSPDVV
jgi:hypothetical protein